MTYRRPSSVRCAAGWMTLCGVVPRSFVWWVERRYLEPEADHAD